MEISAWMQLLGQSGNKIQKTRNPTATSEVSRAKTGYCAWSLHTAPPRGWADHPSHPLDLLWLTPHLRDQLEVQWLGFHASPARAQVQFLVGELTSHMPCGSDQKKERPACPTPLWNKQGKLLLSSLISPNKALPDFLFRPVTNFDWFKS